MNERVIVLGAGASASYTDSLTEIRPPLAREIVRAYHQLEISANRYVLIGDIVNYIRDTRGLDPADFNKWDEDIESVLTEINEEIRHLSAEITKNPEDKLAFGRLVQVTRAYNQFIFLFSCIFNEIQNGPISIPYMLLATELLPNDTVITFNWDTLLDRALMAAGHWSPVDGYSVIPESIFDDGWKEIKDFQFTTSQTRYIKLHGSTNWLSPYHGDNPSTGMPFTLSHYGMDKLFIYWKASKPYVTYEDRYWGPYEPFCYCYYPPNLPLFRDDIMPGYVNIKAVIAPDLPEHGQVTVGEKDVYSMPLIVPPLREKRYDIFGQILSDLWVNAESAISKCMKLYIIGYSFPDTDVLARTMFGRALQRNGSLEKIIVINPNPDRIESLLTKEFGVKQSILEIRREKFQVPSIGSKSIL